MKVDTDVMLMKMYAKASIKKFGEKAVAATVKEYIQINKGDMEVKPVITPIYPDTLSYEENSNAI